MPHPLPATETLKLERAGARLVVMLNRPEQRNAMSGQMVRELNAVFDAIQDDRSVRVVVLRGAGGTFCAGGDIKDMASSGADQSAGNAMQQRNRSFGALCQKVNAAPQVVIAMVEGAAMGGGFGLVCVSDVAIAHQNAVFGMPEVTLGILPAQIAPFVVRRIGMTQARKIALTGQRINGEAARDLGLVHHVCASSEDMDAVLTTTLQQVMAAAPGAIAGTKELLTMVPDVPLEKVLDRAAELFAGAVRGPEGREGTTAFVQKRKAAWVEPLE